MLPSQRALFDIPAEVAYLNAASFSPLPRATQEAARDQFHPENLALALAMLAAWAGLRRKVPLFWLLVVAAGLVVTAAVNGLTLYYARIRANQPATAMLYILVVTVMMGVVPGHLLYFLTRVPV